MDTPTEKKTDDFGKKILLGVVKETIAEYDEALTELDTLSQEK